MGIEIDDQPVGGGEPRAEIGECGEKAGPGGILVGERDDVRLADAKRVAEIGDNGVDGRLANGTWKIVAIGRADADRQQVRLSRPDSEAERAGDGAARLIAKLRPAIARSRLMTRIDLRSAPGKQPVSLVASRRRRLARRAVLRIQLTARAPPAA